MCRRAASGGGSARLSGFGLCLGAGLLVGLRLQPRLGSRLLAIPSRAFHVCPSLWLASLVTEFRTAEYVRGRHEWLPLALAPRIFGVPGIWVSEERRVWEDGRLVRPPDPGACGCRGGISFRELKIFCLRVLFAHQMSCKISELKKDRMMKLRKRKRRETKALKLKTI